MAVLAGLVLLGLVALDVLPFGVLVTDFCVIASVEGGLVMVMVIPVSSSSVIPRTSGPLRRLDGCLRTVGVIAVEPSTTGPTTGSIGPARERIGADEGVTGGFCEQPIRSN